MLSKGFLSFVLRLFTEIPIRFVKAFLGTFFERPGPGEQSIGTLQPRRGRFRRAPSYPFLSYPFVRPLLKVPILVLKAYVKGL